MNVIDLYTKYSITNKYWTLSSKQTNVHYVNIGELIKKLYAIQKLGNNVGNVGLPPYGNSKLLPFDVEFECGKLDDKICNYYYRNIIPPSLFTNDDYKNLGIYNTDPWGRAFPNYMTGAISERYVDALKNNSSYVYNYVVFYQERLMKSTNNSNNIFNLTSGSVPLAIMHVTTVEGEPIVCLDIIH